MLTTREKFGYGLGDTASNFVFQLIVNFLGIYYTDVYGLSPAVVGTLFAVVRLMDAVTDPLMGAICDRVSTRWGRFRPWMLWLSVPFGAATVLAFSVPEDGNVLYAYLTYALLMLLYTAVNIPYCALGGVVSSDPQERVTVQSWRFSLAMVGNIVVSAGTMPMVEYFGDGDQRLGFQSAAIVYAVGAVVLFTACFFWTRERVTAAAVRKSDSVVGDLKALWQNDQWRLLALMNLVLLIGVVMRGTLAPYFVKYVLGEDSIVLTALLTLGSVSAVIGSMVAGQLSQANQARALWLIAATQVGFLLFFLAVQMIDLTMAAVATGAVVIATAISILLGKRFAKVKSFGAIFLLMALAHFCLYLFGSQGVYVAMFFFVAIMFLNQVGVPILWSMMADSVDYGEWKTGRRITGMNFSANLFALKIGVTIGGAGVGYLLSGFGYVANQPQTAQAEFGIALGFAIIPGICGLIVALISCFYRLTETRVREIQQQLGMQPA